MRYSSILLLNYLLYSFLPNHLIKKSTCSNSSFQFHSFRATQIPSRENGKPRNESITLTLKIHNILKHFYSLKKVSHSRSHTYFASLVFDFQVVQISIHCVKRVQIRSFGPNTGKYSQKKTPCLDTFHGVIMQKCNF